jgi:integrase/recombinase XerD
VEVKVKDECERSVVELWRRGRLSSSTICLYLAWIRRFRAYCQQRQLDETDELSLAGVVQFTRFSTRPRLGRKQRARRTCESAQHALHAWSCALQSLGASVPAWREPREKPKLNPLLSEYAHYRRAHNGVAEGTLIRDLDVVRQFLMHLREQGRRVVQTRLVDVDAFTVKQANRVSKSSVVDRCSSLRAFLRFLQTTGRLESDLANGVMAPRFRPSARPPRALPWSDVKRILRCVPQSTSPGKRDFAMLLLMAAYGFGAGEVLSLHLEDIDWQGSILRAYRPKTKVRIELPLLPVVARALAAYLRRERPPAKGITNLFLRKNMPYLPITSGAIRHRMRYYATLAGVSAKIIGAHAFRHSHASRQVDGGANIKVLSDILGHRNASSTSVYVRVAIKRLRRLGLPVPR